jgi:hypothetical protein
MTSDITVHRAASILIEQHGESASLVATLLAGEWFDKGDVAACVFLLSVEETVKGIQAGKKAAL